jgi:hypothetical protein
MEYIEYVIKSALFIVFVGGTFAVILAAYSVKKK